MSLDIKEICRLPPSFIAVFLIGVLASIVGAIAAAWFGFSNIGINSAKIGAQLGASYIGGGENAAAMKEIFDIPNEIFVGTFAVDNILTSIWMFVTTFFSGKRFENKNEKAVPIDSDIKKEPNIIEMMSIFLAGIAILKIADWLSKNVGGIHFLLYLSLVAIIVGQITFLKKTLRFSYTLGVFLFIPFFFSIGAISDFSALNDLPSFVIYMPIIVVSVHGLIIFLFTKIFRIKHHYAAVASQALIGGPSTAIAVAQAKNWKLGIPIAMIAGVFGYTISNFIGVFIYHASVRLISIGY